jgi:hypothetical protein
MACGVRAPFAWGGQHWRLDFTILFLFLFFSATKLQFADFHEIERGLRIMHGMGWQRVGLQWNQHEYWPTWIWTASEN